MNNRIYDMIRFARTYSSPTDRQFKEADLRRFQVELFFKPFFEKLLTKDYIWEHTISMPPKLQPAEAEEFSMLVNDVANHISHMFSKVDISDQKSSSQLYLLQLKKAKDYQLISPENYNNVG
jgi:hypothetical protein